MTNGFDALQLSRIYCRETDSHQDELPDFQQIDIFAEGHQPFGGLFGEQYRQIGGYGIFQVKRADRFQKQHQQE